MVALSAVRSVKMKAYYESLKNRGKKKMVAITVCMRKIITKLNAVIRDGKIIQKYLCLLRYTW
jgi:transposase